MSGFKLIAIRPLIGCYEKFSKNLIKGKIYKFYQEFDFFDKNNELIYNDNYSEYSPDGILINKEVFTIKKNTTVPKNLYGNSQDDNIEINISAIVGKNGSGKSTILELLYALCYIIASEKGIIKNHSDLSKLINAKGINHNNLFRKIDEVQDVYNNLKVELFYEIDNEYFSVRFENHYLLHRLISKSNGKEFFVDHYFDSTGFSRKFSYVYDKLFFYTISINYSLYGLNSENDSNWLNDLFHKNDGYQTPLVINPFREKGNINVNTEYHLAQSRLFTNIVNDNFSLRTPVSDKDIELILFTLDFNKFNTLGIQNIDNIINKFKNEYKLDDNNFIINVYNSLYRNKDYRIKEIDLKNVKNIDIIIKYVFRKVFKIALNYDEYREHFEIPVDEKPIPKIRSFFKQLLKLQDDRSHITLKLRQILNSIRFNILEDDDVNRWIEEEEDYEKIPNKIKKFYFKIGIREFVGRIQKIKKEYPNFEIKELIPAACYIPKFGIKNNDSVESTSNFEDLSSGEQQFIHSIQSILYHVSNLNSVFHSPIEKIKYNYINLVLDEIELYYHPEFQRIFISELLKGIRNLKIENIKSINILFSTHSPFILSDIPHQNILRMKDGDFYLYTNIEKTFGANIHDLLDNDFFLEKGFMGEWAQTKIKALIEYLNGNEKSTTDIEWDKDNSFKLIELIGEPILRNTLRDMYFIKFNDEIENEILRLKSLQINKI
jgi:predicted ATP-binding protein involved in virulence